MKNKAFTLIELLGVIVLITLLSLIIIPNVTTYIKKANTNADETTLSNIKLAAKTYMADHREDFESNDSVTLCVSTLKKEGYLDITSEKAEEFKDKCVKVTINENKYTYELEDKGTTTGKTPTVKMNSYTYGGSVSKPSITYSDNYNNIVYYYSTDKENWVNFDKVSDSKYLKPDTYYMRASYGDSYTSIISFQVFKATLTLNLTMNDYTYGEELGALNVSSEDANVSDFEITYYYSAYSNFKDAKIWNKNEMTSTSLQAGTYYIYAKSNANDYYKSSASSKVKFKVLKQDSKNITITKKEYTYDGKKHIPYLDNETSASIIYEYYKDSSCTEKLNDEPIDVGSYSVIARLDPNDKNHTISNGDECIKDAIAINKRKIVAVCDDENNKFTYDGSTHKAGIKFYAINDEGKNVPIENIIKNEKVNFNITGQINVGNYTSSATIASVDNGKISNYELENIECPFSITKADVSIKTDLTSDDDNYKINIVYGKSGEFRVNVDAAYKVYGKLKIVTTNGVTATFDDGSTETDANNESNYLIKYKSNGYPEDGKATITISFTVNNTYNNNYNNASKEIQININDQTSPVITFDKDGSNNNTIYGGSDIAVNIVDNESGFSKGNQTLYYAFSKDNKTSPFLETKEVGTQKEVKELEVGDYVEMSPESDSFEIDGTYTGSDSKISITPNELNLWKVIKINDDGSVDMVSQYVSEDYITFAGKNGYYNYVGYLNLISKQYENSIYTNDSRHFGYYAQNEFCIDDESCVEDADYMNDVQKLKDNLKGGESCYWLAARTPDYKIAYVDEDGNIQNYDITNSSISCGIRPVVTLKSTAKFITNNNNNSLDNPYKLAKSYEGSITIDNNIDNSKSISATILANASADLTGTYYLWIKGGIKDNNGNESKDTVSKSYNFNNEYPSFKLGTSVTTKSITVTVNGDEENDAWSYKYTLKNENDEILDVSEIISDDSYTFDNLKNGTSYKISVMIKSVNNKSKTKSIIVSTKNFDAPTFEVDDDSYILKIIYPKDKNGNTLCNNGYTCTYKINDDNYDANDDINISYDNDTDSGLTVLKGESNITAIISDGVNEQSTTYTYEPEPIIKDLSSLSEYKNRITKVVFKDNIDTTNSIRSEDVSINSDGSVMAWIIKDNDNEVIINGDTDNTSGDTDNTAYILNIGGIGGVYANKNSSSLFANMINLKEIDFNNNFKTNKVKNYSMMFAYTRKLTKLDISSFVINTNSDVNMKGMFMGASALTSIKFGNINTSKVTSMNSMFKGLDSLIKLNLCQFDFTNVKDLSSMFEDSFSLTKVFVNSTWKNKDVDVIGIENNKVTTGKCINVSVNFCTTFSENNTCFKS